MINRDKIIPAILERLENLPVGHYLDIRTYKRNRYILVVKKNTQDFLVIENGYYFDKFDTDINKIRKLLKPILKKEFPRSNKVRLYAMGKFDEEEALGLKRKVL